MRAYIWIALISLSLVNVAHGQEAPGPQAKKKKSENSGEVMAFAEIEEGEVEPQLGGTWEHRTAAGHGFEVSARVALEEGHEIEPTYFRGNYRLGKFKVGKLPVSYSANAYYNHELGMMTVSPSFKADPAKNVTVIVRPTDVGKVNGRISLGSTAVVQTQTACKKDQDDKCLLHFETELHGGVTGQKGGYWYAEQEMFVGRGRVQGLAAVEMYRAWAAKDPGEAEPAAKLGLSVGIGK
jgi:hypothetical protein